MPRINLPFPLKYVLFNTTPTRIEFKASPITTRKSFQSLVSFNAKTCRAKFHQCPWESLARLLLTFSLFRTKRVIKTAIPRLLYVVCVYVVSAYVLVDCFMLILMPNKTPPPPSAKSLSLESYQSHRGGIWQDWHNWGPTVHSSRPFTADFNLPLPLSSAWLLCSSSSKVLQSEPWLLGLLVTGFFVVLLHVKPCALGP